MVFLLKKNYKIRIDFELDDLKNLNLFMKKGYLPSFHKMSIFFFLENLIFYFSDCLDFCFFRISSKSAIFLRYREFSGSLSSNWRKISMASSNRPWAI